MISGIGGEVKAGYRRAATLGAWSFDPDGARPIKITAEIAEASPLWYGHAAMRSLTLHLGSHRLRWRDLDLQAESGRVMAFVDDSPEEWNI